jgi:hypothetical protein
MGPGPGPGFMCSSDGLVFGRNWLKLTNMGGLLCYGIEKNDDIYISYIIINGKISKRLPG